MTFAYAVSPALQYTGSNGQAICDLWNAGQHYAPNNWAIVSEAGGVLTVDYSQYAEDGPGVNHFTIVFQTGDWVVGQEHVSAADFAAGWRATN